MPAPITSDSKPETRRQAARVKHSAEITAITNQWVNSYKRLQGGGEAPSIINWGHNDRGALVRIPMYKPNKENSTRIEFRSPDSACNPYDSLLSFLWLILILFPSVWVSFGISSSFPPTTLELNPGNFWPLSFADLVLFLITLMLYRIFASWMFFNSFFEEKPILIKNLKNVLKLKKWKTG